MKRKTKRVTIICQGCGNSFGVNQFRANTAAYCSSDCRSYRVTRPCEWCNKPVERTRFEANKTAHTFCNRNCYAEWRKTLTGRKAPRWKGGKVTLICGQCGTPYKTKPSHTSGSRFCSQACLNTWKGDNQRGENNPNWQGGAVDEKYYGPEWPVIREAIRKRDGYTCQRCGIHQRGYFRALDVHHIVDLREFLPDRINEAHDLDNLITLCSSCHRSVHNGASL